MVLYTCKNCLKEFKQKCHYIEHTEKRKNPCQEVRINNIEIIQNYSNLTKTNEKLSKNMENLNKCNYCSKEFYNIYNLKKHQVGHCKVKKEKEKIMEKTKNNMVNVDELKPLSDER